MIRTAAAFLLRVLELRAARRAAEERTRASTIRP